MNKTSIIAVAAAVYFVYFSVAGAAPLYEEAITLSPGWNAISTPRVLDSHAFTASETSENFDIYVLNASSSTGWSTMADLGQTEFTPLYGYFINNKTGGDQTLTLQYSADVSPASRLFSRVFSKTGWYSIGVANPTYAKKRGAVISDSNNPQPILSSIGSDYSQFVDFTYGAYALTPDSVAIDDSWSAFTSFDVNQTADLRETKAYAVFIVVGDALYSGFQNNSMPDCSDGIDNDNDAKIDSNDPGCTDQNDNDEFDYSSALSISAALTPVAQNIIAGGQNVALANIQLDASQSGEDIRVNSLPVYFGNSVSDVASFLKTCQVWNGNTAVTTGSNTQSSAATTTTFVFDNSLVVAKGTVTTLTVKCNVQSNATGTFIVGVNSSFGTFAATGVQSGNSMTTGNGLITVSNSVSGTQTVGTSSLTVSQDSSAPSYALTAGGTSGVNVNALRIRATGEDMTLNEVGLTVSAGGNADVVRATIWNGATQVGSVVFTSASSTATTTLSTPVNLPANTDVVLTIKADVQGVGTGNSGTAGNLIQINFSGARATGNNSGNTVWASGTAVATGVRLERSYPTIALRALPSSGVLDGRLISFTVTANAAGSVSVREFTFNVSSTTGITVADLKLYGYTDASCSTGALNAGNSLNTAAVPASSAASVSTTDVTNGVVTIPAGSTYCFELRATVTSSQTAGSVSTTLLGDSSYARGTTGITSNFTWSPNSTTTITSSGNDFVSGFGVPGLPSSGLTQTRSQ